uniref:(northern house mosquito) hypothetical protein n=1 Tax=Culex pipiens TaxID=7175 RepID=A0A8D8BYW4_CULPI
MLRSIRNNSKVPNLDNIVNTRTKIGFRLNCTKCEPTIEKQKQNIQTPFSIFKFFDFFSSFHCLSTSFLGKYLTCRLFRYKSHFLHFISQTHTHTQTHSH